MKKKIISILLAAVMITSVAAGCGNNADTASGDAAGSKEETKKEEPADSTVQLSAADYEFEKGYMFGDFNYHSNNDTPRQGVDTFEDTDIVFQDIDYSEFVHLLQQEGNYLIQLSGSWCHNSRALSPNVNEYAKEYGIDTIYMYDFDFDNKEDGQTFIRMTNGVETVGAKYNYMYGEVVSNYLANLNDWVQFPADTEAAITYTNAKGEDVTVARLQEPFLFLYNKDNTIDNSESGNGSEKCPIVYAFEEMVDRDADGIYVKEYDAEGNEVTDDDGNPIKTYITDEYKERLKKIFDYIKDNNVELSEYNKEDYVRDSFDSLKDAEQVNIYMVTYRQLTWLLNQDGNAVIMFGGPANTDTQAMISEVNDYAVANDIRVFLCDNEMDSSYTTTTWGYTGRDSTDMFNSDAPIYGMCTELLEKYLTNVNETEITSPYLFAYNKAAEDEDGFVAPVISAGSDAGSAAAVFEGYAEQAGIELKK